MLQGLQNIRRWVVQRSRASLIYISLIILGLDLVFVVINYYSSKQALDKNLYQNAVEEQREFNLTMQMVYRNMMQMALYISQNKELNQLFLKGREAVLREGGGAGGKEAAAIRQQLLDKVKPAWDKLTAAFDIRQLHYHLGPGSLSFLRVHKPQKFGDRMDDLRFIIVDTNDEKTPRFGFETGRIYSGLRGVYPIWATDPKTHQQVYVGALETGTSFKQILPEFAKYFGVNVAVLLTKQHVESKMWPEFIKQYFKENPNNNYYVESSSSDLVKTIAAQTHFSNDFNAKRVQIIKLGNQYLAIFYFPLRDYRGELNKALPASGVVLMWSDATALIESFNKSIVVNVIYALLAFVVVEIALIWLFRREKRLALAEQEANMDGLTNIYNRRHFDKVFAKEFGFVKQLKSPLSIILCDVDFFKHFNDTYGHQAGDDCLRAVAACIKASIKRDSDSVARYGGEEFVMVLPNTSLAQAVARAERIRQQVADLKIKHKSSTVAEFVTISLGVACSDFSTTAADLLKQADDNLYKAKQAGRNRVEPQQGVS